MLPEQHFFGKVNTKAIITKGDQILLCRDHNDIDAWDLPGGRVNIDEDISTAIKREIQEELGVDIKFKSVIYSEQLVHAQDGEPTFYITCKVDLLDPEEPFKIPSEELAETKWVDQNSLDEVKLFRNCIKPMQAYWNNNNYL
jgi:ADP-ribose pyrophosphatase YjhB (NUDIX family)